MLDHSLTLKDRAYALRMDHDLSIRAIAARLGMSRSVVGGWLKGQGETRHFFDCKLCDETFMASSTKPLFCCRQHADKHYSIFGAVAA